MDNDTFQRRTKRRALVAAAIAATAVAIPVGLLWFGAEIYLYAKAGGTFGGYGSAPTPPTDSGWGWEFVSLVISLAALLAVAVTSRLVYHRSIASAQLDRRDTDADALRR